MHNHNAHDAVDGYAGGKRHTDESGVVVCGEAIGGFDYVDVKCVGTVAWQKLRSRGGENLKANKG